MDTAPPDLSVAPAKATESEIAAERFMGGFKPAEWASSGVGGTGPLSRDQLNTIGDIITAYQGNLESKTQDEAGVIMGTAILTSFKERFIKVFGPYTDQQALDLFKNKPMQVIQGLIGGIPYSAPTMPMSIAQAIKQYSYLIPGAAVGKGGGLFRTIKIPKGVTNRPTKYRAPNPVMILMQVTNFIWHLIGLPGMAPYFVSQAAMAYYRSLINFNATERTMTKDDVSRILDALNTNHPAMMGLFYDSQIYSKASKIAREKVKEQLSTARSAFKQELANVNDFDKGQKLFGQLIATSNNISVKATTDPATVKRNILMSYGNPESKPVKLPRGVGYYKVGAGASLGAVKTEMGNKYKYKEGKWGDIPSTYESDLITQATSDLAAKAGAAQELENKQAANDALKAKALLEKQGLYASKYTPAQIAQLEASAKQQIQAAAQAMAGQAV